MQWLVLSVALSLVLTVLLNLARRAFPHLGERVSRSLAEFAAPELDAPRRRAHRARVFVPWKAMIIGSVILTILVNLLR